MNIFANTDTIYVKQFDKEAKKIIDDLNLIMKEKFHHEEHMAILMALNFNVKQISDSKMNDLFSHKLFGKLEELLKGFKVEEDFEGIEIICHIFSNIFI